MKVRTPITLALLVAAIAAPAAQPANLDPGIAAAIRSHQSAQPVPLITDNSASQNLDPGIAAAIGSHESAQPVSLITENSASQNRLTPTIVTVGASDGFDWSAAGIGATVAFAVMLLGLAVARLVPRRGRAQLA